MTTSANSPYEVDSESSDESQFYSYFECDCFHYSSREEYVGPTVAIKDLNNNSSQVTIRARVTNKSDVKQWSKSGKEGKLFNMDLLDDSGEIRMTGFDTSVGKFYDKIEVNRVYDISSFKVKPANKQFTSIKHNYEISFQGNTGVKLCVEDTSDIPQQVTYDFVCIGDIEHVDVGKTIDVIGVCKSVGSFQKGPSRKTGKQFQKRELVLIDDTCKEIVLTLWEKTAEDFSDDTQPIIAVKGVQVSGFGGKSISCRGSSLFKVNPDLEKAHALRKWYDSEGFRLTTQSLSSARAPWKLAVEVTSSDMEKTDLFMCKVTLITIKGDQAVYKGCTACNKKVEDMGNGMYRCNQCATDTPTFKARLMLRCQFGDFTDQFWVTCFHETGEVVLNEKSDTLAEFYFNRRNEFDVFINKAFFQQYIGKFSYKMKTVTVLELTPINHGEYAKQLLNEIRECSS